MIYWRDRCIDEITNKFLFLYSIKQINSKLLCISSVFVEFY